jgi:hypothetical protein
MNDTKERNLIEELESALTAFDNNLDRRSEKIEIIKTNFDKLRNKAKQLQHELQQYLDARGLKHSLKVDVIVKNRADLEKEQKTEFDDEAFELNDAMSFFSQYYVLRVTHTRFQLVDSKRGGVIFSDFFPMITTGDKDIPKFLDEIKAVDGLIPYLEGVLDVELADILQNLNRKGTPIIKENTKKLEANI